MGIPISFYNQPKIIDKKISLPKSLTIDDYLAEATFILSKNLSYNDIDKEPFKKIIQLSNKVIKKDPFNALAYSYIARGEVALGNYKKAIENANKSISINPLISSAYFAKGNAKSALGEKNKGIPEYDQAIKIDPNFYRAYINRGIGKTAIKDYEGAINDFKIAINDKNERSNAYYHLALTKSELEEYNDSVLYLEKSLESLLDDNSFTFLKANIYSAIGFEKTKLKDN